jgi:hypothetical protein
LDASALPDVSHMLGALNQDFDLSPTKGPVVEVLKTVRLDQVKRRCF